MNKWLKVFMIVSCVHAYNFAQESVSKSFEIIEFKIIKTDSISNFKGKAYVDAGKNDTSYKSMQALFLKYLYKKQNIIPKTIMFAQESEYFYVFKGSFAPSKKNKMETNDTATTKRNILERTLFFRQKKISKSQLTFPKDENGKIFFNGEIRLDSIQNLFAWDNANNWLKTLINDKKEDKIMYINQLSGQIEAISSFKVYISSLVSKIPHGIIKYNVTINIKNGILYYTFSDFNFYYIEQNRNLRYEKTAKKSKPLEDEKFSGYKYTWDAHRALTMQKVKSQIAQLHTYIMQKH